jgi:Flp pilus assembly protein TadB
MASNVPISPLLIYAYIIIIFALFYVIVVVLFSKLINIKSFEQIKNELESKKSEQGRISDANKIHSYFQKYTFEELLFFNLKFNGKRYYPYYHYFLLALVEVIFIFIVMICSLKSNLGILLLIIAPTIITLLPIFILGVIRRKRITSFRKKITSFVIFLIWSCLRGLFINSYIVSISVISFLTFSLIIMSLISNRADIISLIQNDINYL